MKHKGEPFTMATAAASVGAGKSAWTKGMADAPKDRMIMSRNPIWDCPVFLRWEEEPTSGGFWRYCEEIISDMHFIHEVHDDDEWAEVPV
jgi:hypothetical protein